MDRSIIGVLRVIFGRRLSAGHFGSCIGILAIAFGAAVAASAAPRDGWLWETGPAAASLPVDSAARTMLPGGTFSLVLDRTEARPGERYVEILLVLEDGQPILPGLAWSVQLRDGDDRPLAQSRQQLSAARTLLSVDVRRHNATPLQLRVTLQDGSRVLGAAGTTLSAAATVPALAEGRRVRVNVDLPEGAVRPAGRVVTFGVPFAAGALWDEDEVRLTDEGGGTVAAQREVTARWGREGSIRWLRFDAALPQDGALYLERGSSGAVAGQPVAVERQGDTIRVSVAGARYVLGPGASPIREIARDGQVVARAGPRGLYVVDQEGRVASASADTEVRVESAGPLSASVRFEGFYRTAGGEPLARHITRVEFFANRPSAQVTHTLVLTRDTNRTWFREIGWELDLAQPAEEAVFGGSPYAAWQQATAVPLSGTRPAVSAFQRDYVQFRGGAKVAQILGLDSGGKEMVLHATEEMGDWAVATGSGSGLFVACRDSARQHPKEIEIARGRVTLRLFSPRGGDELDFRSEALLARWNRGGLVLEEDTKTIAATSSNAAGWAKTHELLLEPVGPGRRTEEFAQLGRLFSQQVYANIDPQWIYETRVMGPLYPKDPERFPDAERFVEQAMAAHLPNGHERDQEYGFVDYFAGPHYRAMGIYRYMLAYSVRMAPWALYARSGERALRSFAEGTNRRYLDNVMIHWDGSAPAEPQAAPAASAPSDDAEDDDDEAGGGGRVRGLYSGSGGGITGLYPYYWGGPGNAYGGGGPNNLNQFLWDYHLTGYRRAGDMVEAYADGMQKWWTPGIRTWYRLKTLRNLWIAYAQTWDQGLRPIIEDYLRLVYDPEGEVGVAFNGIPKYTTYKTDEDTSGLIYGWEMHGDRRVGDLARRLADYTWQHGLGRDPGRYDKGSIGDFLYRETGDPSVPQEVLSFVQTLIVGSTSTTSPSGANPRLFGIPYALSTIAQSGVDRRPHTSYAGVDSYDYPSWFVVRKPDRERVVLHLRGQNVGLSRVDMQSRLQLPSIWQRAEYTRLVLPKDLFGGTYKVSGEMEMIQADGMLPLVLYAPDYFRPMAAAQNPPLRIYFRVPPDPKAPPQICFEAPTQLFDPAGAPFGGPVRGWVDLPADRPGLWSFQSPNHGLVRVNNLPPFFAYHFSETYFEPEIAWATGPAVRPSAQPAAGSTFVPGRGRGDGDQALLLGGRHHLVIGAGETHRSGDGGQFLPAAEGTIEFFIKPYWDTLELYPRGSKTIAAIETDEQPWTLTYGAHTFESSVWTLSPEANFSRRAAGTDGGQEFPKRAYARQKGIVEQEAWIHVAWVWGAEPHDRHGEVLPGFATRLYINGRRAPSMGPQWLVARPDGTPQMLIIGRDMAAAIDGLRISDIGRYHASFEPPASDRELEVDPHTRLLLRFNGNLDGEAHGADAPVRAPVAIAPAGSVD